MIQKHKNAWFYLALTSWLGLIVLTLVWDWAFAPLHTGKWLLIIKLLPLCLPLRGIFSGKIYTYQYCSMLILLYFTEGVMRLWDMGVFSRVMAGVEIGLSMAFFVGCLMYLKQFKISKSKSSSQYSHSTPTQQTQKQNQNQEGTSDVAP